MLINTPHADNNTYRSMEMKVAVFCLGVALVVGNVSGLTRRNVLLIYGDDAGFQMGAYNNTACKTPNFDNLAAKSVVFKHGYTSVSSCSPSRSVLLTGLPQHQNGMFGLHQDPHHFNSMDTVRALPTILGKAGIRTGIIGKKHVGPDDVYKFDYEQTEENNVLNQVGRNITCMKEYVSDFLNAEDTRPFFLYLAYHDPHRCLNPTLGQFCERFGDGQEGHGLIPDWKPVTYRPEDVEVPYYLPDTPATRQDLANMYKTYSRMDQGLGIFLKELEDAGFIDNTLILFSSDNGIPFPGAKTNLYDPGMGEPMMVSSPLHKEHWGKVTEAMGSTMDFVPTILDWFNVTYPKYAIDVGEKDVTLTGKSLLPVAANPDTTQPEYSFVYSSHDMHEVTMFYPMRVLRTNQYKLIHNLNSHAPYPLAGDIYQSPTFLDLLNRTHNNVDTHWFKPLNTYYYRDQWELYDHKADPMELRNLANVTEYQSVLTSMKKQLFGWQTVTSDPWRCYPAGVLERDGCNPLYNGESPSV